MDLPDYRWAGGTCARRELPHRNRVWSARRAAVRNAGLLRLFVHASISGRWCGVRDTARTREVTSRHGPGERVWIKMKNPHYWRRESEIEAMPAVAGAIARSLPLLASMWGEGPERLHP